MHAEAELRFFIKLLEKLHIPSHRFEPDAPPLDQDAQMVSSYEDIVRSVFTHTKAHTIYIAQDASILSYAYMMLPDTEEILFIGPYLLQEITDHMLMQVMERMGMSTAVFPSVKKYVGNLAVLHEEHVLFTALCTLGETLWGGENAFEIERIDREGLLYPVDQINASEHPALMAVSDFKVMENRYKEEKQLMHLIAQGHTHRAQMIIAQMNERTMENRAADGLRNLKNYGIVFNTLARKAVEEGGVHPLHIDRLSSQMARKLENVHSIEECRQLFSTMVHKYCLLVKNHSMKSYSLLVQHVILRIEADLTADLSLKAHAEALNVNASYLSTLFKKETGMTLTEYVSRKRMDHAIFLLNSTDMQVQTIAQYCGIPDVNYFTKTFKRVIGKTPKEYRADTRR